MGLLFLRGFKFRATNNGIQRYISIFFSLRHKQHPLELFESYMDVVISADSEIMSFNKTDNESLNVT